MKIKQILPKQQFRFFSKAILLSLITLFIFSCSSVSKNSFNFYEVNKTMEKAIADSIFPGGVLLFGIDNSFIYSKTFGHYTYDKSSPKMKLNTIFDLASVSKVVGTTSAAMILYDEGKLKLDEKVKTYLPEFNNHGKGVITIRNLLVHNSGLPAFKKYYDIYNTEQEVINDIMNTELIYKPGSKYVYSDLGIITLQKVIEKITGMGLDEFLKEKLFKPLEMTRTMYNPPDSLKNQCAPTEIDTFFRMRPLQGEVHDERAYMLHGVAGHAGLFSTVEDLSKFVRMLLNGGKYKGKQIINPKTIEEWTTKQSNQSDRGLGWEVKSKEKASCGKYFSMNSFGHTGYTGTSIWVDKDKKLFVIMLTNRVYPTRKNRKIYPFRAVIHNAVYKSIFSVNE